MRSHCLLSLCALTICFGLGSCHGSQPAQNVVLIVVDTLRADHLGLYGYPLDTSPNIDGLGRQGLVFSNVYSVSNWTNPTIKSIFTGEYPRAIMREAAHSEATKLPLPEEVTTLAEVAKSQGYSTSALVDHPGITTSLGFGQGFDDYVMLFKQGSAAGRGWAKSESKYVAREFAQRLENAQGRPFFNYLHLVYPHWPYRAPEPYRGLFGDDRYSGILEAERSELIASYDTQIRRTDDVFGMVVEALNSRGLLEDTWIILTSDHGEAFWEHGLVQHGHVFYDEVIKVPLLIVPPVSQRGLARRVETPVSNIDVFATIVDILGASSRVRDEGISLIGRQLDSRRALGRALFSENAHAMDITASAVIKGGMKFMSSPSIGDGVQHLFNLSEDPSESTDLIASFPELAASLSSELDAHLQAAALRRMRLMEEIVDPDERTIDALKTMGYVQ